MKINTGTYVMSVSSHNYRPNPAPSPALPPREMNTIFLSPIKFHSSQVLPWVSFSLFRDWETPSVWVILAWLQTLNSGVFLITHSLLAYWYSNKSHRDFQSTAKWCISWGENGILFWVLQLNIAVWKILIRTPDFSLQLEDGTGKDCSTLVNKWLVNKFMKKKKNILPLQSWGTWLVQSKKSQT